MSDDDTTAVNISSGPGGRSMRDRVSANFTPVVLVRLRYACFLFMALLWCLVMRSSMGALFESVPYLRTGCEYAESSEHGAIAQKICYGNTFVYRVSFALAVFFFLHFCTVSDVTCCIDEPSRAELQTSCFCCKALLLFVLNVAVLWIPNAFFASYAWVCMFVSAAFLVIQIMLIVDFAYALGEEWSERIERMPRFQYYLAFVAGGAYASGIAITIYSYVTFVPHSDCNLHGFSVTINALSSLIYTAISIWVPHGSVVPSGIVFGYTSFVGLTALRSSTDARCNLLYHPLGSDNDGLGHAVGITLLSALLTAGALGYTVVSIGGGDCQESMSLAGADEEQDRRDADNSILFGMSQSLRSYSYFHLIMLMGSMYLAMLATDWSISGDATAGASAQQSEDRHAVVSFWVKLATQWLTILMYVWSLLAPYFCLSDRNFGYDNDW
jgi:hypothetical protein